MFYVLCLFFSICSHFFFCNLFAICFSEGEDSGGEGEGLRVRVSVADLLSSFQRSRLRAQHQVLRVTQQVNQNVKCPRTA